MTTGRDRPYSLAEPPRYLSKAECDAIGARVLGMAAGGGTTLVVVESDWSGSVRWARNRTSVAADRRTVSVAITRSLDSATATVSTNQLDDDALANAVRAAERLTRDLPTTPPDSRTPPVLHSYPDTKIWSDASAAQTTTDRAKAVAPLMDGAEQAGMLSAGYFGTTARSFAVVGSDIGPSMYAAQTLAECSTTVRDPRGTGSGWAGASGYDLARVTPATLGARALQKCLTSRNPVAIEPGRYTLIMEAQAVYDLARLIVLGPPGLTRPLPEQQAGGPWFDRQDPATGLFLAKLGQKVVDERITIEQDPSDPALGIVPFMFDGEFEPYRATKWIDRGVLTRLGYPRLYALRLLAENLGYPLSASFRMSGGTTSIEEMIRTTKRGLLVTRFWEASVLDLRSLLSVGLTRDGLWLIENGAISHPVKNLRFTESPLFAFNSVDQLGVPEPIFAPGFPAIVPPMKVRDFSFTSLVDAI